MLQVFAKKSLKNSHPEPMTTYEKLLWVLDDCVFWRYWHRKFFLVFLPWDANRCSVAEASCVVSVALFASN